MTQRRLIDRRMAIADLGRAGLAIMVFGAAACADGAGGDNKSSTSPDQRASADTSKTSTPAPTNSSATTPVRFSDTTAYERVHLDFVSAYILYRDGEAAVVDTGVTNSEAAIEAALAGIGLGWDAVGHLILTHKHPDHQGSAEAVIAAAPGISVYAGHQELSRIETSITPIGVGEGDHVFDLRIIDTPGHTAGHIAVLDEASGILVLGDAMNGAGSGVGGSGTGIGGANPRFSEDMSAANASIKKLATFEYRYVLFGHGEPLLENGSARVREFAAQLP